MRYKVRFTRQMTVEHAYPPEERRGGFRTQTINAGTIMELGESSYRFWSLRNCIELVEKIGDDDLPKAAVKRIEESKPLFRVKFIAEGKVEKARADGKRGGFSTVTIPVGTVMEVDAATLQFWSVRNCIEFLGTVESTLAVSEPSTLVVPEPASTETPRPLKAPLQRALANAKEMILAGADPRQALLNLGSVDAFMHPDLSEETREPLLSLVDDVFNSEQPTFATRTPQEVLTLMEKAIYDLLPPSQKKNVL